MNRYRSYQSQRPIDRDKEVVRPKIMRKMISYSEVIDGLAKLQDQESIVKFRDHAIKSGFDTADLDRMLSMLDSKQLVAPRPKLLVPPGARARRALEWLFTKKTMTNVFEPILADMQAEWMAAMIAKQDGRAKWIAVRGMLSLGRALVAETGLGLIGDVVAAVRKLG
jgi:hypothetical protein